MKTATKQAPKARKTATPERLPNVHPGKILRTEVLEARGISQTLLADATGLPVSRINDLVKERRGITVDSAIRLARALGTSPQLWLGLQIDYEMEEAMRSKGPEYTRIKALPVKDAA